MQVGIDVKCMHIIFGGCDFFGFGDMVTLQKWLNFPFGAWTIESVVLKAAFCLPILVLQRSSKKLQNKTITSHIDRRLSLWSQGAFLDLLREEEAIQSRLPLMSVTSHKDRLARTFANLMMEGKVGRAIRL